MREKKRTKEDPTQEFPCTLGCAQAVAHAGLADELGGGEASDGQGREADNHLGGAKRGVN